MIKIAIPVEEAPVKCGADSHNTGGFPDSLETLALHALFRT